MAAVGTSIRVTMARSGKPMLRTMTAMLPSRELPKMASRAPMLPTISTADVMPTVNSTRNLASTMALRGTGASSRVSSVPRSFSPAPRSMAGYMAAVRHTISSRYGTMPPTMAPICSRSLAVDCLSSTMGCRAKASWAGLRFRADSALSRRLAL